MCGRRRSRPHTGRTRPSVGRCSVGSLRTPAITWRRAPARSATRRPPAGQRRLLVRERPQVQALPQAARGQGAPGGRVADALRARGDPASGVRRDGHRPPVGGGAGQVARDHRADADRRRHRRRGAAARRRDGPPGDHHRRDRRLRARAVHRARRLPEPAQLQPLPEERVHERQRGDLPRHPGHPRAAGRRHPQHRRHHVHRRGPRRHQRHVLRRRRRPGVPPARAGHRGVHVARHRGGATGPAAVARSVARSSRTPSGSSTAW